MLPVLLIGGASRRMGHPKSLLERDGIPVGLYLCRLLEAVTGRVPVLSGQGSIGPETDRYQRINDREPGAGPLSALLGLYDHLPDCDFLVLATDMPAMDSDALAWLIDQAESTTRPAIWPRFSQRPFGEPLAACYRMAAGPLLQDAWSRGVRSLKRSLREEQRSEPVIPASLERAFANVNTPEQWALLRNEPG